MRLFWLPQQNQGGDRWAAETGNVTPAHRVNKYSSHGHDGFQELCDGCVLSCFSCVRPCATLWTIACLAPLSTELSDGWLHLTEVPRTQGPQKMLPSPFLGIWDRNPGDSEPQTYTRVHTHTG